MENENSEENKTSEKTEAEKSEEKIKKENDERIEETNEEREQEAVKTQLNDDQKSFLKFLAIGAIIFIAVIAFRYYGTSGDYNSSVSGNVVASSNGEVQNVKMYVEGGQYILEPSSFKVGTRVKIEADMSQMPGCSKSIVIPTFGIRKSLSAGNNIIEFTPTKAGTFNIACSMNMYRGTFEVLEAGGTKSNYVEEAPTGGCGGGSGGGCGGGGSSGGGCGGGGGGCGCGG